MIGISFDVDDLRYRVLRFVAQRVNNHAAANWTVRTGTARLGSPLDLQPLCLRIHRRQTESKYTNACASDQGRLDEGSSGDIHKTYLRGKQIFLVTMLDGAQLKGLQR